VARHVNAIHVNPNGGVGSQGAGQAALTANGDKRHGAAGWTLGGNRQVGHCALHVLDVADLCHFHVLTGHGRDRHWRRLHGFFHLAGGDNDFFQCAFLRLLLCQRAGGHQHRGDGNSERATAQQPDVVCMVFHSRFFPNYVMQWMHDAARLSEQVTAGRRVLGKGNGKIQTCGWSKTSLSPIRQVPSTWRQPSIADIQISSGPELRQGMQARSGGVAD